MSKIIILVIVAIVCGLAALGIAAPFFIYKIATGPHTDNNITTAYDLGDWAKITLPQSFEKNDYGSGYTPLTDIGNQELQQLKESSSSVNFEFQSDYWTDLGGNRNYTIQLTPTFFENNAALNSYLVSLNPTNPNTALLSSVGGLIEIKNGTEGYQNLLFTDPTRHFALYLFYRTGKYRSDQAKSFLQSVASSMTVDQNVLNQYFRSAHQLIDSRGSFENENLAVLNSYLATHGMPGIRINAAAAHNGIVYMACRGSDSVLYLNIAKYVGELNEQQLLQRVPSGENIQDALLRTGILSALRVKDVLTCLSRAAQNIFATGLGKNPFDDTSSSAYFYSVNGPNLTLTTLDPQSAFAKVESAQLEIPQ
jgi:hypothetical protein